jgi:glycosyltransferase involved in cell wall biosynthesis
MKPAKILYVISSLDVGGTERHLARVIPQLDRTRWQTAVHCLGWRGLFADRLAAQGIPVLGPPNPSRRRFLPVVQRMINLRRHMLEWRPAIVHFFLPEAYLIGAPAALLAGVPVRVMSRRSLNVYQRNSRLAGLIEPHLHRRMQAVLGNSRSVVHDLQAEGVAAERLGLIYNGIEIEPDDSQSDRITTRQTLGIAPSSLVFGIVANLIPYKGHRDLIEAMALASPRLPPDWRLLVIGRDDGIAEDLRQQAIQRGVADNVVFLGPRLDIPALLAACDVALLSSHEEGFSNTILEGMAAALPTIATAVGGNPEAVLDGVTGLIVPPRDPQSFAGAVLKLAYDARLRATMGANAKRRVTEYFNLDRCVDAYQALYAALLSGQRPCDVPEIAIDAVGDRIAAT